jgi:hypothetical protein
VLQAINVTGAAALDFGSVLPGINYTVDAASGASAGRFDLTGVASANVNLSFTLPTDLNSGGNLLPIGSEPLPQQRRNPGGMQRPLGWRHRDRVQRRWREVGAIGATVTPSGSAGRHHHTDDHPERGLLPASPTDRATQVRTVKVSYRSAVRIHRIECVDASPHCSSPSPVTRPLSGGRVSGVRT